MVGKAVHVAFYPSDWLAGTRGLTPSETGVYITLVCMMYERKSPLPFDQARLARMCNCPAGTFKKTLDTLLGEGKLIELTGGLWNGRVEREIAAADVAMSAASERARRAAESRWSKSERASGDRENATVNSQSVEQDSALNTPKKPNDYSAAEMQEYCASNANQNQNQRNNDDEAAPLKSSIEEMAPRPEASPDVLDESEWKAWIASAMGISERDARKLCDQIGMDEIRSWIAMPHVTAEAICSRISLVMRRLSGRRAPSSLKYFTPEIRDLSDEMAQPANEPVPSSGRRAPTRTSAAASAESKPVDDDALARRWVDAVKAGKTYAASAIRKATALRMLELELVTEDELRRCGVAC